MSFPVLASTGSESWEDQASCREHDAELFFGPNRFEPKAERLQREAAAKAVCRACPVTRDCLTHADATGEVFGVWGGLSEAERRERDIAGVA